MIKSTNKIKFIFYLIILIIPIKAYAVSLFNGVSSPIAKENNFHITEDCRIRIVNSYQGSIKISKDKGNTWIKQGKVILPTEKVNQSGYTASKWSYSSCVAATAVNAIHIKIGTNTTQDSGVVFSILPRNLLTAPENYTSYLSPDASIYTNIWAGKSIFGGGLSPFVGNPVYLESSQNGQLKSLPIGYNPITGDIFVIKVLRPVLLPQEIIIENRFGGKVYIRYPRQNKKCIAQVLSPLSGAGRFLGTQYANTGRIRANHSGVLDISTAQFNRFGGFQIIPANHGMSPEMITARIMSQWLVVGPTKVKDPSFENIAPLFSFYIRPSYSKNALESDNWKERLASHYLVQIKTQAHNKSDLWQFFPRTFYSLTRALPHRAMKVFDNIKLIRILFPVYPHP